MNTHALTQIKWKQHDPSATCRHCWWDHPHLTEHFLQFISTIRKVVEAPDVTSFAIRVAVMSAGLPLLCQWISSMPATLSGLTIYKELAPHRLTGGKTMMRDLAEFVGEVICTYGELDMPLRAVVKYQFPVDALTAMLSGEVFNIDAVLDDFSWHLSKTLPANTRDTDLYLDRDRLELISKLFSTVFKLFGCDSDEVDMSFVLTVQKLRSRLFTLKALESSYDLTVYNALLRGEQYGAIPWFRNCLLLGIQNIGRRSRTRSHSALDPKCFIPAHYTQVREVCLLAGETVQRELHKWMIIGEYISAILLCALMSSPTCLN